MKDAGIKFPEFSETSGHCSDAKFCVLKSPENAGFNGKLRLVGNEG